MNQDKASETRIQETRLSEGLDSSRNGEHRPGFVSSLGKLSIFVLSSSFAVSFGSVAFLTFLWVADTNNTIWRKIVLAGWTTRSVTISALILRWATATQAITCTSMLAGILLQKFAVPLPSAAAVSIMRFDNTGPWTLLGRLRTDWNKGSIYVALLALLLTLTTLSLQFTSTVLLSQVGLGSLLVTSVVPNTLYQADPDGPSFLSQLSANRQFLDTTPKGYPAFAEWVSNATISDSNTQYGEYPAHESPGIVDTGTVMRAFLPFRDVNERSRITEYHGFGTVVDTRVVCTRPKIRNAVYRTGSGYRISGLVDTEEVPPGFLQQVDSSGSKNFSMSFDCGFAAAAEGFSVARGGWPLALCIPFADNSKQGIFSVMEPKGKEELGPTYLLINATLREGVTTMDGSDVWESFELTAEDYSFNTANFQITMCMTAFEAQNMKIHATRTAPIPPEPTLTWDTKIAAHDTRDVLRQFGIAKTSLSTEERGIFKLEGRSWQWPARPEYVSLTGGTFATTSALEGINGGTYGLYRDFMNEAQYDILAHVMSATSNPALAIQTFFTTLFAIKYHERIIMFDTAAPSSQVSLVQVTRPLGWAAFIVVVTVVVFHLLLVLCTILWFFDAVRLSYIGNAWMTISQILGPITKDWITDGDLVTDKAVTARLKNSGLDRTLVRVEHVQSRLQLVQKGEIL